MKFPLIITRFSHLTHGTAHDVSSHLSGKVVFSHSPHAMLRLWHSMHIVSYGAIL